MAHALAGSPPVRSGWPAGDSYARVSRCGGCSTGAGVGQTNVRRKGLGVILPNDRDLRFVTIRRSGILTAADYQLLALWAATCAEHVLHHVESAQPNDPRP